MADNLNRMRVNLCSVVHTLNELDRMTDEDLEETLEGIESMTVHDCELVGEFLKHWRRVAEVS